MKNKQAKNKLLYFSFQIINNITSLTIPILIGKIIDAISTYSSLYYRHFSLIFIATTIIFIISLSLANYYKNIYEEMKVKDYRKKVYNYIGYAPFHDVNKKTVGYYINRFNDDIEAIRPFFIEIPFKKVLNIIITLFIFLIMFQKNIPFTLALLLVFPIFFIIQKKMTQKLRVVNKEIQLNKELLNSDLEEYVNFNYTIRANNAIESLINKNILTLNEYIKNIFIKLRLDTIYDYFLATGLLNLISIIVYVLGGYLVLKGKITIGTLTMFSMYYSKLWNPIEFYIAYPKLKAEYDVHHERLSTILTFEKTNGKKTTNISPINLLELRNISISHGEKLIIEHLNLKVQKNDKIGLWGDNGSGKTTIANLLAGIHQQYTGEIFLNNISYQTLDENTIRQHIRLIPSKPDIFYGSVEDNITMFQPKNLVKIHTITSTLEANNINLDLMTSGKRSNLSAGEQKLIQLARGLLFDADIYILDEPLNFIDKKHKNLILKFLSEQYSNKTLIIISHDMLAFDIVDKIYQIENKKLKEMKP